MAKFAFVIAYFIVTLSPSTLFATDWQTDRKDWTHDSLIPEETISGELSLQWTRKATLPFFSQPLFYKGNYYFLEYSQGLSPVWAVYGIEKSSGKEIWRVNGQGTIRGGLAASSNLIFIPSTVLTAFDSLSGQKQWELINEEGDFSNLAISGTKVFALGRSATRLSSNAIFSLNISDGSIIWKKPFSTGNTLPSAMSVYKNTVLIAWTDSASNTNIRSFDQISGSENWTFIYPSNNSGPLVVDQANGLGFISNVVGKLIELNLDTGLMLREIDKGTDASTPILVDGKAYFLSNSLNDITLNSFNYINNTLGQSQRITSETGNWTVPNQVVVGDRIYMPTKKGELWSFLLNGSDIKKTTISPNVTFGSVIYANDTFLLNNYPSNTIYAVSAAPSVIHANSEIVLTSPYKTDGEYNEYLGQTHSHYLPDVASWSEVFNGEPTPSYTEREYKNAGYDFVALTEHNTITESPGAGILHITNSEEDTQGSGGNHILALGINTPVDESRSEQERIDQVNTQGGVALLSHPNSKDYPWSLEKLLSASGYSGIEVFNGSGFQWRPAKKLIGSYRSFDKWDGLLSLGKKDIWATAGDDYTPGDGGFDNAAIIVRAKSLDQSEIFQNIKEGNFYAVQGSGAPRLRIDLENSKVIVTSNLNGTIRFIGNNGQELQKTTGLSASYLSQGNEKYIRVEVEANGKKAWSQPIFVQDLREAKSESPGIFHFDLGEGKLVSNNTGTVSASTLSNDQYPNKLPPLGYLSPVYTFVSNGQVQNGTELSLDYSSAPGWVDDESLSIYSFDDIVSDWVKIPCSIDKANKNITAKLSHFSLYTLSAEMAPDTEGPIISLLEPNELSSLEGNVNFITRIEDTSNVISSHIIIDDQFDYSSLQADENHWQTDIDLNELPPGSHELTFIAEDFYGNLGQAAYYVSISSSGLEPPMLSMNTPAAGAYLSGQSEINGTYSSQFDINSIEILLDDVVITYAEIDGERYTTKMIDWSQFKQGPHLLKASLIDIKGHTAYQEQFVTIIPEVQILSPKETYMHSDLIPIELSGGIENLVLKVDGIELLDISSIKAYTLTLGTHLFTVEFQGIVLASKEFQIETNINDQIKLMNEFWANGYIKNKGIYNSIVVKLELAQKEIDFNKVKQKLAHVRSFITRKDSHMHKVAVYILLESLTYCIDQFN